jgi:hypothetical protein
MCRVRLLVRVVCGDRHINVEAICSPCSTINARSLLSRMSEQVYAASRSSAWSNAMYSTQHNSKDVVSEAIARSKKHNESTSITTKRKVTNHPSILSVPQSQSGIKHFGSSTPHPSTTNRHHPPNAAIPTCARIFCHCNPSPAKKILDYALQSTPREQCRAARTVCVYEGMGKRMPKPVTARQAVQ